MTTSIDEIQARARARRRGRKVRRSSVAAAAIIAAAAVTGGALSHDGRSTSDSLAAWTVVSKPNGIVTVAIRDLRDPAGLQQALRKRGVTARVQFAARGSMMTGCDIEVQTPAGARLESTFRQVFLQVPGASHGQILLYINPKAVPKTAEIGIGALSGNGLTLDLLNLAGKCLQGSQPASIGIRK
jgi:hypothetical protein